MKCVVFVSVRVCVCVRLTRSVRLHVDCYSGVREKVESVPGGALFVESVSLKIHAMDVHLCT